MQRCLAFLPAAALLAACPGPASHTPSPVRGDPPPSGDSARPGVAPVIRNALPAIAATDGPLRIRVAYPGEGAVLTVADSNFVFGSVGTGRARLAINGTSVDVAPNGAFLAFLPVPADGVYRFSTAAGTETQEMQVRVRVPARPVAGEGFDAASISPRGAITGVAGERVTVRVRGASGARARIVLPDGSSFPLVERQAVERAEGFQQDRSIAARAVTEYAGTFPLSASFGAADAMPTLAPVDARAGVAAIEWDVNGRIVRQPLPLVVAVLAPGEVRVGVAASARADAAVIGTAVPGSGTPYQWSFPNGTRFTLTGEREGAYRVRLTGDLSVWVPAADVRLEPAGLPAVAGSVGTVRLAPQPEWVDVRLALSDRLPFEVQAEDRALTVSVYGAQTRTNWLQYGFADPLVLRAEWAQPRDDLYTVRLALADAVWGWRAFWDADGTLVIRVRRPPVIDRAAPLRGIRVAVDAGHPPGGAIGPTGLTEAEANLAVAKRLVTLLREAGAEVLETRPDTAAVDLGARPRRAAEWDAHLLVSVHNNAFPDGVNPFENNGTSTFYNQAPSLDFARALQAELVRELGLRDLGVARADLALVRNPWMPSALTETMFLMVPQQEAALRDPAVQERIARAHFRAIETFFRERAR